MKSKLRDVFEDRLFIGIVLLQISMFSLLRSNAVDETMSLGHLLNALSSKRAAVGHPLPSFAAYSQSGQRHDLLEAPNRYTTVIFASCSCDTSRINHWAKAAISRNESVIIVIQSAPQELHALKAELNLPSQVQFLVARRSEFTYSHLTWLPSAVHIASNGIVVSIEQ